MKRAKIESWHDTKLWHEPELDPMTICLRFPVSLLFPLRSTSRVFVDPYIEKRNPRYPSGYCRYYRPHRSWSLIRVYGYCHNPLNKKQANRISGLLHKYYGRVLITLSGACAAHCRYYFRRHFPYNANTPGKEGWNRISTTWNRIRKYHRNYSKRRRSSDGEGYFINIIIEFIAQSQTITHLYPSFGGDPWANYFWIH